MESDNKSVLGVVTYKKWTTKNTAGIDSASWSCRHGCMKYAKIAKIIIPMG